TDGVCSFGLKPMNATFLPLTSSPTRRMRGCGSPGPCRAATDQVGSVDSVTIKTCTPSQAGELSGSEVSTASTFGESSSGALAFNGPVTESNGLRSMIGSPLFSSRGGTASLYGGTTTVEPTPEGAAATAEPISCV